MHHHSHCFLTIINDFLYNILTNFLTIFLDFLTAAGLAQSAESLTVEREVTGSIPRTGLKLRVLK